MQLARIKAPVTSRQPSALIYGKGREDGQQCRPGWSCTSQGHAGLVATMADGQQRHDGQDPLLVHAAR